MNVSVAGVLPESAFSRNGIFTSLMLLQAIDDFKDGFAVVDFAGTGGDNRPQRTAYASARLFARNLTDVAPLADYVRQTGVEVKTHAKAIADIQQTDRVLSYVFQVIAWVAITGGAISLSGFMLANVDRKRHNLAMLRLLGFSWLGVAMYPVLQALLIATLGYSIAAGAYLLGASAFDNLLGVYMQESGFICRLTLKQALIAGLITHFVVFIAAIIGGYRAVQIEPAETFRQQ